MTNAKQCMDCLESLFSEWHSQNEAGSNSAFLLEGSAFAHAINAWGDAAAVCIKHRSGTDMEDHDLSTAHALEEMMRVQQLFDKAIDACKSSFHGAKHKRIESEGNIRMVASADMNTLQMLHLLRTSHKVQCNVIAHIDTIDALRRVDTSHKPLPCSSYFGIFFPKIEQILRRSG